MRHGDVGVVVLSSLPPQVLLLEVVVLFSLSSEVQVVMAEVQMNTLLLVFLYSDGTSMIFFCASWTPG